MRQAAATCREGTLERRSLSLPPAGTNVCRRNRNHNGQKQSDASSARPRHKPACAGGRSRGSSAAGVESIRGARPGRQRQTWKPAPPPRPSEPGPLSGTCQDAPIRPQGSGCPAPQPLPPEPLLPGARRQPSCPTREWGRHAEGRVWLPRPAGLPGAASSSLPGPRAFIKGTLLPGQG